MGSENHPGVNVDETGHVLGGSAKFPITPIVFPAYQENHQRQPSATSHHRGQLSLPIAFPVTIDQQN